MIKANKYIMVIGIKGGVGKSIVSGSIALRLSENYNKRVAFVDCDIASSNTVDVLKIASNVKMTYTPGANKLVAVRVNKNLFVSSMSLFMDNITSSFVTKSAQFSQIVKDFICSTVYDYNDADFDFAIFDVPAGSGDETETVISILKKKNLSAIIVTQPNTIVDFRRAVDLCRRCCVPVIGVVINMYKTLTESGCSAVCPKTGKEYIPFSVKGIDKYLESNQFKNVWRIPLIENFSLSKICNYVDNIIKEVI